MKEIKEIFNPLNYPGNFVMHCKTEEEAIQFLKCLESYGLCWCTTEKYCNKTNWHHHKEKTCYNFNEGTYGSIEIFADEESFFGPYKILEWSDFMVGGTESKETFTKKDLKDFDYIVLRNGMVELVSVSLNNTIVVVDPDEDCSIVGGFGRLDDYSEDLTCDFEYQFDIIEVYRPKNEISNCPLRYLEGELIYERPKKKKMTLEEIREKLGFDFEIVEEGV